MRGCRGEEMEIRAVQRRRKAGEGYRTSRLRIQIVTAHTACILAYYICGAPALDLLDRRPPHHSLHRLLRDRLRLRVEQDKERSRTVLGQIAGPHRVSEP